MRKIIDFLIEILEKFTRLNVVKKVIVVCCIFILLFCFGIVFTSIKAKFDKNYLSPIEKFRIDSTKASKTEIKIQKYENIINSSDSSRIRDSVQIANGILVQ